MKLSIKDLKNKKVWEEAGIGLPSYDVTALQERTKTSPRWVHFGIGNIFRIFLGGIADRLISQGLLDTGIVCAETFDYDIADKIYAPCDNLCLAVTLYEDGSMKKQVLGSLAECVKADSADEASWARMKEIFRDPGLQMVSFTITEKGYGLRGTDGNYLGYVRKDMENGPSAPTGAMAVVAAMLLARFQAGAAPLALVSMDNCSHNGALLRTSVLTVAEEWQKKGFVTGDFLSYIQNEEKVSFPWTMIDKITPRPADFVAEGLAKDGVEGMDILVTSKNTYIAPFVNSEAPGYLVIEDRFPNGRPPLEKAGVYMTDRETVNKSERMKVTACLNPIHTALAPYGMLLGYEYFADLMDDEELKVLAHNVGYVEGLPRVVDPGIFSAREFLDEVIEKRMPNKYLGDSTARICTDSSQGVGVRFGETIRSYAAEFGTADMLEAIPLALAGWLRYFYAVDDEGNAFTLAPDPLAEELHRIVTEVPLGSPVKLTDQVHRILSNTEIFGSDLYEAGVGQKVEALFREEIAGPGAVRATLKRHLA